MRETFKKLPEKKQTQILNAAARVFARKGYDRANVSDICRKARISNGALYKYFRNKEEVYLATLHRMVGLFSETQAKYLPVNKSIYEVIHDMLKEVESFAQSHSDYIVIYLDLGSPSMKRFSDAVSERIERPSRDFWVKLVEEGKRRGEVDTKLNSEIAAYAVDNHSMLFMFSCVSPHYGRRFDSYFAPEAKKIEPKDKKQLTIESIRKLLT